MILGILLICAFKSNLGLDLAVEDFCTIVRKDDRFVLSGGQVDHFVSFTHFVVWCLMCFIFQTRDVVELINYKYAPKISLNTKISGRFRNANWFNIIPNKHQISAFATKQVHQTRFNLY